jgi:dethiobiotin synthetase
LPKSPDCARVRGLFVTGTGTGVGKTIVSAALLASMRATGELVRAYKPVVTGLTEPPVEWPPDHELLALAAGMMPEKIAPLRFDPPVSPHLAAAMAGKPLDPRSLIERAKASAGVHANGVLIVEGVGGLLVPLTDDFSVRDLAVEIALPLLIVGRPGLGTINHTLLTIESARTAGLSVAAVVLTPWSGEPSRLERSNRETIAQLGGIEVATLSAVRSPKLSDLVTAGDALPWRDWL